MTIGTRSTPARSATVLTRLGARVVAREGSFIVADKPYSLLPGDLERARDWAAPLAEAAEPATAGSVAR